MNVSYSPTSSPNLYSNPSISSVCLFIDDMSDFNMSILSSLNALEYFVVTFSYSFVRLYNVSMISSSIGFGSSPDSRYGSITNRLCSSVTFVTRL